jgi:uncharacterized ferritin-like protein (DUF455 family)
LSTQRHQYDDFSAHKGLVNYEKARKDQHLAKTEIVPKPRIEANRLKHVIAQLAAVLYTIKLTSNMSLVTS